MTERELDILASKIASMVAIQPRWIRLKAASIYSSIGQKRLKELSLTGAIRGYQDPDSKRGDWIFDRLSIDQYRENPIRETQDNVSSALAKIRKAM